MHPKITCHMIASLDGRLATERWSHEATDPARDLIHRVYDQTSARLGGDGWIVGRRTMGELTGCERVPHPLPAPVTRDPFKGRRGKRNLAVVIDPLGKLDFAGRDIDGDHLVTVLSERVEDSHLADLRGKGVSYVFAGPDGGDLRRALRALHCLFGVRHLQLQGGGRTNGAFLAAGLIDSFSTLIFPAIDGMHGIPAIADHRGEMPATRLRLAAAETLEEGVVWLRHSVEYDNDTSAT